LRFPKKGDKCYLWIFGQKIWERGDGADEIPTQREWSGSRTKQLSNQRIRTKYIYKMKKTEKVFNEVNNGLGYIQNLNDKRNEEHQEPFLFLSAQRDEVDICGQTF
jgi:hypothetical protein